jgi:hypothetical protein
MVPRESQKGFKMDIVITNDFHKTQRVLKAKRATFTNEHGDAAFLISPRQAKRSWSALCGHKGCVCGGALGQRGRQAYDSSEPNLDGSVTIYFSNQNGI